MIPAGGGLGGDGFGLYSSVKRLLSYPHPIPHPPASRSGPSGMVFWVSPTKKVSGQELGPTPLSRRGICHHQSVRVHCLERFFAAQLIFLPDGMSKLHLSGPDVFFSSPVLRPGQFSINQPLFKHGWGLRKSYSEAGANRVKGLEQKMILWRAIEGGFFASWPRVAARNAVQTLLRRARRSGK